MINDFSELSCRTRCGLQSLGIHSLEEAKDYYYKNGNDFSSFLVARHIGKKSLIEIKAALFGITDATAEDRPCAQSASESRAISVAEELINLVNHYGVAKQSFARTICKAHKTLQQSIMRLFITVIREMAKNENVDDRNRASVELAKKIVEVADEHPLPFI